jgi:class 3 adenylate cyclase
VTDRHTDRKVASMVVQVRGPDRRIQSPEYAVLHSLEGAALFIDVRRSSQIVTFVERHLGIDQAASLFMRFLTGTMEAINGPTMTTCRPNGDAVLATFTGKARVCDAVDAAARAINFVHKEFNADNQRLLSCNGGCGFYRCPGLLRFDVGAGIDAGFIAVSQMSSPSWHHEELVSSCINVSSKLSGRVSSPLSVAITLDAYRQAAPGQLSNYQWHQRIMKIAGQYRRVQLTDPRRSAEI